MPRSGSWNLGRGRLNRPGQPVPSWPDGYLSKSEQHERYFGTGAAPDCPGECRRRPVGGGAPDRRAVDDQHRHGRCRGTAEQVAALARAGSETRAHHRRPRRGCRRRAAHQGAARQDGRAMCRSSATSTTSATSFWPIIPACAEALDKYRINPGNVGFKEKKDKQFSAIVEMRDQARQAGAHRRQLGLARSGTAHAPDGRERASRRSRRTRAR